VWFGAVDIVAAITGSDTSRQWEGSKFDTPCRMETWNRLPKYLAQLIRFAG